MAILLLSVFGKAYQAFFYLKNCTLLHNVMLTDLHFFPALELFLNFMNS